MDSFNHCMEQYVAELKKGYIQKAYKGIMTFMTDLKTDLEGNYPDYAASALYFGYMDMTYFAFTPPELKNKNLKIAVVYLHGENMFECWLAGNNRKVQKEYHQYLSKKNLDKYTLSKIGSGVDSIIACSLVEKPDFNELENLKKQIEEKTMEFIKDMHTIIEK